MSDFEVTIEQMRAISAFLDGTMRRFIKQYLELERLLNAYRAVTPKEYKELAEPGVDKKQR